MQFVFSKLYQRNSDGSINSSMWMNLFYAVYSIIMFGVAVAFSPSVSEPALVYGFVYSVSGIAAMLFAVIGMGYGNVSPITTFMYLGSMILPFVYGVAILGESLTVTKIIAILLMTAALVPNLITGKKSTSISDPKRKLIYTLILLAVFMANGFVSITSKAHQISSEAVSTNDFMFIVSLMQFVMTMSGTLIPAAVRSSKNKTGFVKTLFSGVGKNYSVKGIAVAALCSFAFGVCNALANVFSLTCAKTMPSSVQYPVLSATVIVFTVFAAWLVYKEKPKTKDILSIILSVAGVIIFIF